MIIRLLAAAASSVLAVFAWKYAVASTLLLRIVLLVVCFWSWSLVLGLAFGRLAGNRLGVIKDTIKPPSLLDRVLSWLGRAFEKALGLNTGPYAG
jgi:hypothetical protein